MLDDLGHVVTACGGGEYEKGRQEMCIKLRQQSGQVKSKLQRHFIERTTGRCATSFTISKTVQLNEHKYSIVICKILVANKHLPSQKFGNYIFISIFYIDFLFLNFTC